MDKLQEILKSLEVPVQSEFCLTPTQCYQVTTYLPSWFSLLCIAGGVVIIKNLMKWIMELTILSIVLGINTILNTFNLFQFKQLISRIERLENPYFKK